MLVSTIWTTAKPMLLDTRLLERTGTGLAETLTALRDEGLGWREIAERIGAAGDLTISHEAVRAWHAVAVAAAGAAA